MNTQVVTLAAVALATLVSIGLVVLAMQRLMRGRAPRFRFAEVAVWVAAPIGFVLAWFPGFIYGGHFGGAVMSAFSGLVHLPPAVPVAVGIAVGMTVALTALALILPALAAYMLLKDKAG